MGEIHISKAVDQKTSTIFHVNAKMMGDMAERKLTSKFCGLMSRWHTPTTWCK
jgi:hypothetical protein